MVVDAQRTLNTFGYNAGKPDGGVGAKMRTAIKLFQRQNALTVDGLISAELAERLRAGGRISSSRQWQGGCSVAVSLNKRSTSVRD